MSNKTVKFGPFAPQELEVLIRDLQLKNLPFEIQKQEEESYVTLARKDLPQIASRLEQLGFPSEVPEGGIEFETRPSDEVFQRAKFEKSKFNRRLAVWVILVGLICLWFIFYAIST
jgi:hypothetical protein